MKPCNPIRFDPGIGSYQIPSGVHYGAPHGELLRVTPLRAPDWEHLRNPGKLTISICNPMPFVTCPVTKVNEISPLEAQTYLKDKRELKLIKQQDLTDYADLLSQVAKWIQIRGYHGAVVPLRGGMKPWNQLTVMTELSLSHCWLPFTQGANGVDHDQIRFYLSTYLKTLTDTSPLRLAIIDTADSGDSAATLAKLLKTIRTEFRDGSTWMVDFILFFESLGGKKRCPPKSVAVPRMSNDNIVFRVFACGTRSLITEDWDAALGIKTEWKDGSTPSVLIVPSNGRVVVQDYTGELREYESDRLDHFTDLLLGQEVSDAVTTDKSLTFREDVWQKYDDVEGRVLPPIKQDEEGGGKT